MAVVKIPLSTTLSLKIENGVNAQGKTIHAVRNFGFIKPDSKEADLLDIGTAIGSLMSTAVVEINRVDYAHIVNQG